MRETDTESSLRKTLKHLLIARNNYAPGDGSYAEIWQMMHTLADAQYEPAKELFIVGLADLDWGWRLDCLRCLGFHFDIAPESEVAYKVRNILRSDPQPDVRLSAAAVLGEISTWPDEALLESLEQDEDEDVRRSAFAALLKLAGVPLPIIQLNEDMATQGEISTDRQELGRVLIEVGLSAQLL